MSTKFTRDEILDAAVEHFGINRETFYSEDQPRGEDGRWTGGGDAGKAAENAKTSHEHIAAYEYHKQAADALEKAGNTRAAQAHTDAAGRHLYAGGRYGDNPSAGKTAGRASRDAHAVTRGDKSATTISERNAMRRGKHGADETHAQQFGARSAVRLSFAAGVTLNDEGDLPIRNVDGVDYVVGKPIHIFPNGKWTAVDGREVEFNAIDANAMLSELKTRHSDVALTFDHETDKARGSEAAGWMPIGSFSFRDDGLWNDAPLWRKDVYATLLQTGAFRYLSGDALGIGTAHPGDAFHPRRLLAASLVPKPGFVRGLKGITLAADEKAAIEAWLEPLTEPKKETFMAKMTRAELCQQMGIDPGADAQTFEAALVKWAKQEAAEPEHKEAMGASDDLCEACKDGKECDDLNCECPECEDDEEKENKMGANKETAPAAGTDEKLTAEQFAALGTKIAGETLAATKTQIDEGIKTAGEAAAKLVEAKFAAEKREREVNDLIGEALKDGRLKGDAMATVFRETFAASHELGVKMLTALPKPEIAPQEALSAKNAFIMPSGAGVRTRDDLKAIFDNPDRDPRKYAEQGRVLTAVARFGSNTRRETQDAFDAVLKGENEALEKELFSAGNRTAEDFGGEFVGGFRKGLRQIEVDADLAAFIAKNAEKVPAIGKFTSLTDFQPAARTTLPMALGYPQAEFVGDEALPVFVGGADEKAAWPEFAFEKFAAIAQAVGLLGAPTRTSMNVTWHTVTLEKYPVQMDIDRRARAASITLPRGLDTIALENLKSQVGVTKESAQATFMKTTGNYFDATYYPSVTPWSNAGTPAAYGGLPIDDLTKGMAHIRVGIRQWPELLLLSPNAALSLRKNQQIIDAVRYTGTKDNPGTMLTNSQLAALFAGLLNLTIVVGEAGSASLPNGQPVTDVWGNDAWLVATGKGQIEAPRFGMTVASAGSPRVRAFPQEGLGADGADSIVYTDAWQLVSIAKKAAYWMQGASAAL